MFSFEGLGIARVVRERCQDYIIRSPSDNNGLRNHLCSPYIAFLVLTWDFQSCEGGIDLGGWG